MVNGKVALWLELTKYYKSVPSLRVFRICGTTVFYFRHYSTLLITMQLSKYVYFTRIVQEKIVASFFSQQDISIVMSGTPKSIEILPLPKLRRSHKDKTITNTSTKKEK